MIPIAASVLGFALARANSCTVASTRRLIIERRADWLLGLLVVIGWAGLVLLGLSIVAPDHFRLPAGLPLNALLVVGGIMLGVGAVINKGCFLGSVSQLSRGNSNYLLTLVGIAIALRLIEFKAGGPLPATARGTQQAGGAGIAGAIALVAFAMLAAYSVRSFLQRRRATMLALIIVGIAGGTIYALSPDWSYTSVLDRAVHGNFGGRIWYEESAALLLFGGALLSSSLRHKFDLVRPSVRAAAGCLAGGFLMGAGAKLIPGGNDALMLWSIPGLTAYGIVAYFVMIATIACLTVLMSSDRKWRTTGARTKLKPELPRVSGP